MTLNWRSAFLPANGINLHYTRTGGDLPPVVLCHGFTDNGLCWTRLVRRLETTYDLIMVDARGHGLSDAPASGYTSADQAADIAGLIRQLDLARPAIIGHSMGAATAAAVAANYPDLVGRIVLEDPPWWSADTEDDAAAREAARESWRSENLKQKRQTPQEVIAAARLDRPSWHDLEWEAWAKSKIQVDLAAFATIGPETTSWQRLVGQIRCPILLVTADPELGALVTAETAREAASLWLDGQVAYIPGAGHNIRREQFEPFVQAVTSFLSSG